MLAGISRPMPMLPPRRDPLKAKRKIQKL